MIVTRDRVVEVLREAVADRGEDYRYQHPEAADSSNDACLYVWNLPDGRQPGCIVGYVLHRLGVTLKQLSQFDSTLFGGTGFETAVARFAVRALARDGAITFPTDEEHDRVASLLMAVQEYQDAGYTWGESVTHALDEAD